MVPAAAEVTGGGSSLAVVTAPSSSPPPGLDPTQFAALQTSLVALVGSALTTSEETICKSIEISLKAS